jgi:hypothetical protein
MEVTRESQTKKTEKIKKVKKSKKKDGSKNKGDKKLSIQEPEKGFGKTKRLKLCLALGKNKLKRL